MFLFIEVLVSSPVRLKSGKPLLLTVYIYLPWAGLTRVFSGGFFLKTRGILWLLRTQFSGGLGSVKLTVGLNDFRRLFILSDS